MSRFPNPRTRPVRLLSAVLLGLAAAGLPLAGLPLAGPCLAAEAAGDSSPTVEGELPGWRDGGGLALGLKAPASLPLSWQGIWEFDYTMVDCIFGFPLDQSSRTDTLCAGDPYELDEGGLVLDCQGTITDTEADLVCTGEQEVEPGCVATYTVTMDMTRNGDEMTGTQEIVVNEGSGCSSPGETCVELLLDGTRVDDAAEECTQTPVTGSSWGAIKQTYR